MRPQFTPGPWKPCRPSEGFDGPYYDRDEDAVDDRPFTKIVAEHETIASAHDLFTFTDANARLIAAAPALYEALAAIVNDPDSWLVLRVADMERAEEAMKLAEDGE